MTMRMLLGIAAITLLYFMCSTSGASSGAQTDGPPKGLLPRTVTGHNLTVDTAKKAALAKAAGEITAILNLQAFVVTEDYVAKNVVVKEGKPGEDVRLPNIADPFKTWVYTFRSDKDWWNDLAHRDQEAQRALRSEERQAITSRVMIGLSILLLAAFGYVRLDEYTHRRYTNWLRVAGVGVAGTLAAGWWWVMTRAG